MRMMAIAIVLALACAGCATMTRGTTVPVNILSDPPEATARTSLGHSCLTPCTLQINRKDEFIVTFSKPGYHSEEIQVVAQLAGAGAAGFIGNVVAGGIVGMAVDASTGATLEHIPNPVAAQLEPIQRGEAPRVNRRGPPPLPPPVGAPGGSPVRTQ